MERAESLAAATEDGRLADRLSAHEARRLFVTREATVGSGPHIVVRFRLTAGTGLNLEEAAAHLAMITSVRTLGSLPFETPAGRFDLAGKVLSPIEPFGHVARFARSGHVSIAYPLALCEEPEGLTQLIALMATGADYRYSEDYWVEDIELPAEFVERFRGPRFGVQGIRDLFGISERPIIGAEIAPRTGVALDTVAKNAYDALVGGADFVCDDLLLVDPPGELGLGKRAAALARVCERAARTTGENKLYFVNVGTSAIRASNMARVACAEGAGGVMINGFAMGLASAEEFVGLLDPSVPVLNSNLGGGILTRPKPLENGALGTGISEIIVSKLSRLAGSDGVNAGTSGGECFEQEGWGPAVLALRSNFFGIAPSFAVAEGDMTVAHVWGNVRSLGPDVLFEVCTGIFGYPGGPAQGAEAFRALVEVLRPEMSVEEAGEAMRQLYNRRRSVVKEAFDHYGFTP